MIMPWKDTSKPTIQQFARFTSAVPKVCVASKGVYPWGRATSQLAFIRPIYPSCLLQPSSSLLGPTSLPP